MPSGEQLPKMEYRFLGRSGLQVSAISLGGWYAIYQVVFSGLRLTLTFIGSLTVVLLVMVRTVWESPAKIRTLT